MTWIHTIPPGKAGPDLESVYQDIIDRRGKLSNIMRVQSLNPAVMVSHTDLYMSIMFGKSELKRAEREMIGTTVSVANECSYCTSHHAHALLHYWKESARVQHLVDGRYDEAGLDGKAVAMIGYANKLTKGPGEIYEHDVEELRQFGLSDSAILDLNLIVSYFNFVNRIAVGLGVEFDENEVAGYVY